MIHKKIKSFILMLCLMQSALTHAFNPVHYVKSFYNASDVYARENIVVVASLLVSVVGVVAALVYKKNKKVDGGKNASSNGSVEQNVTEPEAPSVEEVVLPENGVNPDSVEKKILVTIKMKPLYEQSSGSYDAYLQKA